MVRQFPSTLPSAAASHRAALARWRLVNPSYRRSLHAVATSSTSRLTRPCSSTGLTPHSTTATIATPHVRFITSSHAVAARSLFTPTNPNLYPRRHDSKGQALKDGDQDGSEEDGDRDRLNKRREQPPNESDQGSTRSPSASSGTSSSSESSASSDGSAASSPPSSDNGDDGVPPASSSSGNSLSRRSVPDVYPQVLALPITRRPLFPGFYKAVVIRNPAVIAAIQESLQRGQPYIGAFLLKDENADSDM